MDNIKRLGTPLLVLILAALITRLMNAYMHIPYQSMILLIIEVTSLFLFGMFPTRAMAEETVRSLRRCLPSYLRSCFCFCSWVSFPLTGWNSFCT